MLPLQGTAQNVHHSQRPDSGLGETAPTWHRRVPPLRCHGNGGWWARADNGGGSPAPLGGRCRASSPGGRPPGAQGPAGQAPGVRREGSRVGLTAASVAQRLKRHGATAPPVWFNRCLGPGLPSAGSWGEQGSHCQEVFVGQPRASSRARKGKAGPWRACRRLPAQADVAVSVLCQANPVLRPRDTDKQELIKNTTRGGRPV